MSYNFTKNLYWKVNGFSSESSSLNLSIGTFLISYMFSFLFSISKTKFKEVNFIFSFFNEVVILKLKSINSKNSFDWSLFKSLIEYSKFKMELWIFFLELINKMCLSLCKVLFWFSSSEFLKFVNSESFIKWDKIVSSSSLKFLKFPNFIKISNKYFFSLIDKEEDDCFFIKKFENLDKKNKITFGNLFILLIFLIIL